jgi:hypothetical protein
MTTTELQQEIKRPGVNNSTPISEAEFDRNFKPKGAVAFFLLLILLGCIIWYGIYFLMLQRA